MSKRPPNFSKPDLKQSSNKKKCTYVELQAASKSCWTGLLVCQKCHAIPQRYERDHEFSWSLELFCDNCRTSFKICTFCPNNTKQFHTNEKLKKHCYLKSHVKTVKRFSTETPIATHQEHQFEDSAEYTENQSSQFSINKNALIFLQEKPPILHTLIMQSRNEISIISVVFS